MSALREAITTPAMSFYIIGGWCVGIICYSLIDCFYGNVQSRELWYEASLQPGFANSAWISLPIFPPINMWFYDCVNVWMGLTSFTNTWVHLSDNSLLFKSCILCSGLVARDCHLVENHLICVFLPYNQMCSLRIPKNGNQQQLQSEQYESQRNIFIL